MARPRSTSWATSCRHVEEAGKAEAPTTSLPVPVRTAFDFLADLHPACRRPAPGRCEGVSGRRLAEGQVVLDKAKGLDPGPHRRGPTGSRPADGDHLFAEDDGPRSRTVPRRRRGSTRSPTRRAFTTGGGDLATFQAEPAAAAADHRPSAIFSVRSVGRDRTVIGCQPLRTTGGTGASHAPPLGSAPAPHPSPRPSSWLSSTACSPRTRRRP